MAPMSGSLRTLPQSFVGGEVSPEMFGRPDDPRAQNGAGRLRNVLVQPSGSAPRRPGSEFVRSSRNHDRKARLFDVRFGTQSLQVEMGSRQEYPGSSAIPGYFRFHANAASLLCASAWSAATAYQVADQVMQGGVLYRCVLAHTNHAPPNVTYWKSLDYVPDRPFGPAQLGFSLLAYDNGTGQFTTANPHGLVENQVVSFTLGPGGVMVGPFVVGQAYYVHVVDGTHFQLDDVTPFAAAITGGAPGAGHLVMAWPFGAVDCITFPVPHGLQTNDPIVFTIDSGAALPAPLGPGSPYWAEVLNSTQIRVKGSTTTPAYVFQTQGSAGGQFRMSYAYGVGDLASFTGAVFYCRQSPIVNGSPSTNPPTESCWYQLPASLEYEIPHALDISDDELFAITSSQQGDVLSLATHTAAASELSRVSATRWLWASIAFGPSIAAPTGLVGSPTFGDTLEIASLGTSVTSGSVTTTTEHKLSPGLDFVYIEGSAEASINARFFSVESGSGSKNFKLVDPATGAYVPIAVATGGGTARVVKLNSNTSNSYVVTAVGPDGRESARSAVLTITNNLTTLGASNLITWAAVAGATIYRVYKLQDNQYGWIGDAESTSFKDEQIAPEYGLAPPRFDLTLNTAPGAYPRAVTHFEGRRGFGGTDSDTQGIWLTRSNTESDLSYHLPVQDDDRISHRIKSLTACTIHHMVPLGQLVVLTDTAEFRISPLNSDAITPSSFAARPQSYVGASTVAPVVLHNRLVFAAAQGGHLFQLAWSEAGGGYLSEDICERAAHLFDGLSIVQMAAQRSPWPMVWALSSNGRLLGVTFVPSQEVLAWHWHDTDGVIESVSVGRDGGQEFVYLVVRRTIDGATKRYIERMRSPSEVPLADSWFVDCGLRYTGAPVSTISGLGHLEQKVVAVFADGRMQTPKKVVGGQITLDTAASQVLVGLPLVAEWQTRPATFAIEAYGEGRPKSVTKVFLRVQNAAGFDVGPALDNLSRPHQIADGEVFSGVVDVLVPSEWTWGGQLFVQQADPLPLSIVSFCAEMAVGG